MMRFLRLSPHGPELRFAAVLLAFGLTALPGAYAQNREGTGLGIMVGEPTGVSFKTWIDQDRAIDAGIAWSFSGDDSLHLHADYLLHHFGVFKNHKLPGQLPLYYGLGGRIKLEDDDNGRGDDEDTLVGLRLPVGIAYLFAEAPFDLFAEIVPVLDLVPDTDLDLNAAVGVRYYF
jgi:hypothetical protein